MICYVKYRLLIMFKKMYAKSLFRSQPAFFYRCRSQHLKSIRIPPIKAVFGGSGLFIPDPDPALNFPSSGSRQKFRIQPILIKYI